MVIEYIGLTGDDDAANTHVISTIARYFEEELDYRIPDNYPFAGKDFNATSAGIHVDGLAKNEEIYNIFDTKTILGREVPIIITDKSGRAGVAYWINQKLELSGEQQVCKTNPSVGRIYSAILESYENGRTTSFSNKEMLALVKRHMPELFPSEFERVRQMARTLAATLMKRLADRITIEGPGNENYPWMGKVLKEFPFVQYMNLTDADGRMLANAIIDPKYKAVYEKLPLGFDLSGREWFRVPMKTGTQHVTDIYQSQFTGLLIVTVSAPVLDENDDIKGVIGIDIQLEELLRRAEILEDDAEPPIAS
jgi:hypothetical protein